MTGRPIPALAHHGSLLADLLTRLRRAELVLLVAPGRLAEAAREVAEFFARAADRDIPTVPARTDDWFDLTFTAEAGTRRQCRFDAVIQTVPLA